MKSTWWKSGDWNAICDVCGHKYKASQLKLRWDGLMTCQADWEIRHPQELIRPIPDQSKLPWTRPEATDIFIAKCTVNGRSDIAGLAVAGCSLLGNHIHDIETVATSRTVGDV
jgi:hypothetical protein